MVPVLSWTVGSGVRITLWLIPISWLGGYLALLKAPRFSAPPLFPDLFSEDSCASWLREQGPAGVANPC